MKFEYRLGVSRRWEGVLLTGGMMLTNNSRDKIEAAIKGQKENEIDKEGDDIQHFLINRHYIIDQVRVFHYQVLPEKVLK